MSGTVLFRIMKRQWMFGVTSGEHGVGGYEWRLPHSDRLESALFGVPLDVLVGEALGDGSVVEVTVRVVKRRRLRTNPWWRRERKRRGLSS